ncbi:SDR family oxidoreductase [Micromonospora globbae]|jgi:NAD(P)-dependent dehydrogenase (short-subunit alcohol dehydrogenase family)|uniref:SDR family NAD(P)-dependent oxidoreductase n=1 Tax=Micromonospora globbae TaxID=1894969 RepID=A0A420F1S1_9ACTN|nr:SDR family oxidoreductase [Micromonospora globbae]RKF26909.1 SDR family NAD(P)-dependent oxidoreductase [Micromonospora globbae]WTF88334.1 SDR family oxidoreductase [Micromonospora globbae]
MTQSVVVTGASAGVGRAVARAYAARGARVALLARGEAGLAAAERDCRERGAADVRTYRLDVADAAAVQHAADDVVAHWGALDVWVNNAMVSVFAPTWEVTPAEFRRVTEVNYLGTVHGTLAALRHMRASGRGAIVQVGSALAYRGIPLQAAYCATKHAIQGFNDSLRAELLHDCPAVRLSMVQLPAVNTPQFSWVRTRLPRHPQPVPPIFTPELAARAILWAADRGVRELNVGGPTWRARLGDMLVPGLLDRKLARDGYGSQQTGTRVDPSRWRDNLDRPRDDERDHGADGVFTDQARNRSAALWVGTHKRAVSGLALAGLALALAGAAARRL